MYLNRICISTAEYELHVANRLMHKIHTMHAVACIKPHTKPQHIYLDRVLILYDFWGKVSLNIIKNHFNSVSKMYKFRNCSTFFSKLRDQLFTHRDRKHRVVPCSVPQKERQLHDRQRALAEASATRLLNTSLCLQYY